MTQCGNDDGGRVDQPGQSRGNIYAETLALSWFVTGAVPFARAFHLLDASRAPGHETDWNVRIYGQQLLQSIVGAVLSPPSLVTFDAGALPVSSLQARVTWQGGAQPCFLDVDVGGSALLNIPKCRNVSVSLLVPALSAKAILGAPTLWQDSALPAGAVTGGLYTARVNATAYASPNPTERSRLRLTQAVDVAANGVAFLTPPAGAQRLTLYDGPQAPAAANPGNLYRWVQAQDAALITTLPFGNLQTNDASVVPGIASAVQVQGDPGLASRVTAVWELE